MKPLRTLPSDLIRYKELCEAGTLYEYMMDGSDEDRVRSKYACLPPSFSTTPTIRAPLGTGSNANSRRLPICFGTYASSTIATPPT